MYFSRVRIKPDIRDLSHLHHVLRGNGYSVHQLLFDLFPGTKERTFLFREEIANEQISHYRGARGEPIYYVVSEGKPIRETPLLNVDSKLYDPQISEGDRLSFKLRANPTVARKKAGKENSVRHDVVMDAQYHLLHELTKVAGGDNTGKKSDLKQRILSAWLATENLKITAILEQIIKDNERHQDILVHKLTPVKLLDVALKAYADSALEKWLIDKGNKKGFTVVRDEKRQLLKFQAEGYLWHALSKKGRTAGFSAIDFDGEIEVVNPDLFVEALFTGIGPAKGFGCGLMLVRRV